MTTREYRAVFAYPAPWGGPDAFAHGHGPARDTRAEAEADHPVRPEETHGRRVGIEVRDVTPWRVEPRHLAEGAS